MKYSIFGFFLFILSFSLSSQTVEKYYEEVNNTFISISNATLDYCQEVKHGGSVQMVDQKRSKVISDTQSAKAKLEKLGKWDNQTELYDAVLGYYGKSLYQLENAFQTLLDLEKHKKESVENMVVYLDKEKKIRDEYFQISSTASKACAAFSVKNNLNITASNDEKVAQLKSSNAAYDYYDQVFLMQFKCTIWEEKLMAAIESKDLVAMQKAGDNLAQFAREGIAKIKQLAGFNGDARMVNPTVQLLEFYLNEGEQHVPAQIQFFKDKQHFEQHAAEMKAKTSRTKQDVDNFNNEMRSLKEKTELYNRENNKLNAQRVYVVNVWNNEAKNFIDHNVTL